MLNGSTVTINSDHINYAAVREALRLKDHATVERLINVVNSVVNFARGKVTIKNEQVFYGDMEVKGAVVQRIIEMVRENFDAQPMLQFLANLMDNPSKTAIDELYLFLEASSLPITEDGCFLAYKKVNSDYKDFYTKTFDNSVGTVCKVARNTVDDNRNRTCSNGLHFCSLDYLPHYHGGQGRVMIVKINPRDVVSIPSDYDNAKGRTCEYTVVGEHTSETEHAFTSPVYRDAVPVTAPVCAPYVAPTATPVNNSGLEGYNAGRSDASRGYRSKDVGGPAYMEAYEKGWNSIMNPTPVIKTIDPQAEYDAGAAAGSLQAMTDSDELNCYNAVITTGSEDYIAGYEQGYNNNYSVDWWNVGYEAGDQDANEGNPYNDTLTRTAHDEDDDVYRKGYADGWHQAKVNKIYT